MGDRGIPRKMMLQCDSKSCHGQHTWHNVVLYPDSEYRTCDRCKRKSKWVVVNGQLVHDTAYDPNPYQDEQDQRRDTDAKLGRPKGSGKKEQ